MYRKNNTPPINICQKCGKRLGNIIPGGKWNYWVWEDRLGRRSIIGYCHPYNCLEALDDERLF